MPDAERGASDSKSDSAASPKKSTKSNIPKEVSEAKELILVAALKLRGLKEDYQRIAWALEDFVEELDDVEAGEKTARHKQSQSILKEVEALIAKQSEA